MAIIVSACEMDIDPSDRGGQKPWPRMERAVEGLTVATDSVTDQQSGR